MRIVLVGPTYPYRGGIAHHTTLLARHLGERHEVTLLSFARGYPAPLFPGRTDRDPSRAVVRGAAAYTLDALRPWTWWRTARRAADARPDLVIVQWWVPFWAPSLALTAVLTRRWSGAPIVFICHNVLPHDGGGAFDRLLTRGALGRGDAYIVHSAADGDALAGLLPDADARTHRALLPAHTIAGPAPERRAARAALGLPEDAAVALFFGFVRPYKGLEILVDALPAALERVPGLHLVAAGEFWTPVGRFRARAERLGVSERVLLDDRYVPNEEVGRYFAAADVVVLPYLEATQSGVVTLAAEFSRPVIATRVGGLPEVVEDGVSGLIVPPAEAADLAAALDRLFNEEGLAECLAQGAGRARDRFGWDRLVALIESLERTQRLPNPKKPV